MFYKEIQKKKLNTVYQKTNCNFSHSFSVFHHILSFFSFLSFFRLMQFFNFSPFHCVFSSCALFVLPKNSPNYRMLFYFIFASAQLAFFLIFSHILFSSVRSFPCLTFLFFRTCISYTQYFSDFFLLLPSRF